jgi:hypothetical protein
MKDKQALRNQEMCDFLDAAYLAPTKYVDELPAHLWEE